MAWMDTPPKKVEVNKDGSIVGGEKNEEGDGGDGGEGEQKDEN